MTLRYATDFGNKRVWTEKGAFSEKYDQANTITVANGGAGLTINNGDTIYFGIIPAGTEVQTVTLITGAFGANTTLELGWVPVPSSANLTLPVTPSGQSAVPSYGATAYAGITPTNTAAGANASWWFAAQSVAIAGIFESSAFPQSFDFDVILQGIAGGAGGVNYAAGVGLCVVVQGKARGSAQ